MTCCTEIRWKYAPMLRQHKQKGNNKHDYLGLRDANAVVSAKKLNRNCAALAVVFGDSFDFSTAVCFWHFVLLVLDGEIVSKHGLDSEIVNMGVNSLVLDSEIVNMGVNGLVHDSEIVNMGVNSLVLDNEIVNMGVNGLVLDSEIVNMGVNGLPEQSAHR